MALITWAIDRSEEHTSELQSPLNISYAVFCLKKKKYKLHMQKSNPLRLTLSLLRGAALATSFLWKIFFFFNDTATTEIYTLSDTLSLHDALPIYVSVFTLASLLAGLATSIS